MEARTQLAKKLLKEVEQVGFIDNNRLTMMGGELCINATLAFASTLGKKGKLFASGIGESVYYENIKKKTTLKLPLKYKKEKNIILFNGIGFIINNQNVNKKILRKLSNKYKLPAFGAINYKRNKISPYVYVKQVGSFVRETACGSGSIAFSIFSGYNKIVQPTGKAIEVNINKNNVEIKAEVTRIR
jgi:histidine racemase